MPKKPQQLCSGECTGAAAAAKAVRGPGSRFRSSQARRIYVRKDHSDSLTSMAVLHT